MPYAGPDGYIDDFVTIDTRIALTGDVRQGRREQWQVMILTSEDSREIKQVYIVDTAAGERYPVEPKVLSVSDLESIKDAAPPFTPIVSE